MSNISPESTEQVEPIAQDEKAYAILEKGPFPLLNMQDPQTVLSLHEELLRSRIGNCMHIEDDEDLKIENLACTLFSGTSPDENGVSLYRNGMSISLWDVNGKLALIATSDNVSFVGAIKKRDSQIDMLNVELSYGPQHDPSSSWIEVSHKANQDVEKVLRDWAKYHKAKKSEKALENYYRLISFHVDSCRTDERWGREWKLKTPLLFLTHCALRQHYNKRVMFDKNPLIDWLEKNSKLPTFEHQYRKEDN